MASEHRPLMVTPPSSPMDTCTDEHNDTHTSDKQTVSDEINRRVLA